jgi:outer membrane protein OmpA-like peptidoglycan-associated protein
MIGRRYRRGADEVPGAGDQQGTGTMRNFIIIATGMGLGLSAAASAQTAKNTPEGIICAMTGSCDAPAADGERVQVGNEKAFSLSRPATTSNTPTRAANTAPTRPRAVAATPRRAVAAPKVRPGGGIDMLVTFPLGSAQMTPRAQAEARAFAQAMAAPQMAGMRFAIEGHTDASGARDKNMALSQARAQSVVDYLGSQGVDPGRLTAKGYGPDRPLRGTRATAPANRRVEFVKQG